MSTLGMDRGATDGVTGLGKALGNMTGLSIDQQGIIWGAYDNGDTIALGQIAVTTFTNASGLESIGNNCYDQTLNSGEFDGIGQDVTADGGKISTGVLEMSNVDLAKEFTEMITTQRGFQANSRVITTSDTLLEELINLKR
jgi:flagellar hook protein FlgE